MLIVLCVIVDQNEHINLIVFFFNILNCAISEISNSLFIVYITNINFGHCSEVLLEKYNTLSH